MDRFARTSGRGGIGYSVRDVNKIPIINRLIIAEVDSYKKQYLRPFSTNVNNKDLSIFKDIVKEKVSKGQTDNFIKTSLVNELAHTATLSDKPIAEAPIINGWGTKRFKFALEIEWKIKGTQKSYIEYIQGYTDYFGYSNLNGGEGVIDEKNMRFYPNSILRLIKNVDRNGMPIVRIVNSYKLVKDETNIMKDLKVADHSTVISEIYGNRIADSALDVYSNVNEFTEGAVIEKEINIPILYLSNLIKELLDTIELGSGDLGEDDDTYKDLLKNVTYNYLKDIDFLKWIVNLKANEFYWFTIDELALLDNYVGNKIKPILKSPIQPVGYLPTSDTAETYGSDYETKIATYVQEGISDLMSECFLKHIAFNVTNINGKMTWALNNASAVVEALNPAPFIPKFMNLFNKFIWSVITQHEQILLSLEIIAYAEGDTVIIVKLENDEEGIIYRFPSFANSKFSPLIMDNNHLLSNASDIGNLIDIGATESEMELRKAASLYSNPNFFQ